MRITVITPIFPISGQPYRGMPVYQTVLALKEIAEVNVICPISWYFNLLKPRSYVYSRAKDDFQPPGIAARYIQYPVLPMLSRGFNGYTAAACILNATRASKPDLILSYWLYPEGHAAVLVGKKLGVPVIVGSRGSDLRRIPGAISRALTRRTLQSADYVLTVSQDLNAHATDLGANKLRVRSILNGCDSRIFYPRDQQAARELRNIQTDQKLIVFVGRLDWNKGLRELFRATKMLTTIFPSIRVALVGGGESIIAEIEQLALQLGIHDHLILAGSSAPEEVAGWITASDVCCLPSYSEGCPNFVLEALACGRPVVATNVGGTPEIVDERCGVLIEPRNEDQLAQALLGTLQKDWDYAAISRQSQRTWGKVAQETLEVCQLVLKQRESVLTPGTKQDKAAYSVAGTPLLAMRRK